MTIDIARYDANKAYIQDYWKNVKKKDLHRAISHLAGITMVPCIAVVYWIGEIDGYTPEILKAIQGFKSFYGYTKIEGRAEGSPE